MIKKIIFIIMIYVLYPNLLWAESATFAYRCKMDNGAVGYYDHPCDYMSDFHNGIFRGRKSIEEAIFVFKTYGKTKKGNNIYAYKINNKPSGKKLTTKQLADRRCKNAITKIPVVEKLLKDQNNKQILVKIKRSLARYNAIKNKYCEKLQDD